MIRELLGLSSDDDEDDDAGGWGVFSSSDDSSETDDRACRISGHDYDGQWRLYGYFARTGAFSRKKFKIRKKEVASCRKCDKADTREEVIGYVKVTSDDELEVV